MDGTTFFDKVLTLRGLNPNALAQAINRPTAQSGFDRFRKGLISQPRGDALKLAAKHLGVDPLAFIDEATASREWKRLTGEGAAAVLPTETSKLPQDEADLVITQFDTGGSMGHGFNLLDHPPGMIKSWRVDQEWLRLNVPVHTGVKNLAIVTGFGPSMRPMFNPGDPLLVDTGVKVVDHEGVYFFRVGDEGYIKLIQRVPEFNGPGVILRIISKNPDFPPYDLSPKNPHFEVLGKVLTVWRSEQF